MIALMSMIFVLSGCGTGKVYCENEMYTLYVGEVEISPGKDAVGVLDALGVPISHSEEKEGCGSDEYVGVYKYQGIGIKTKHVSGREIIDTVTITDDTVRTSKGITVGSSRNDVIAAYGENFEEHPSGIVYRKGQVSLNFSIRDDRVVLLYYDYEFQ